jgi:hypothetical protein
MSFVSKLNIHFMKIANGWLCKCGTLNPTLADYCWACGRKK